MSDDYETTISQIQQMGEAKKPEADQGHPLMGANREKALANLDEILKLRRTSPVFHSVSVSDVLLKPMQEVTKFPEVLFVEYFLPFFAGEVPATEDINYEVWIAKVAGGERMPVDIVDENGNVLYRVPELFDASVMENTSVNGQSMTVIERQYSRLKEIDSNASQNFLANSMTQAHLRQEPSAHAYENTRVWNEIFKRYGREDKIINLIDPNKEVREESDRKEPEARSEIEGLDFD